MLETCFSGQKYKYYEQRPSSTTATTDDNEEYVFTDKENSTKTSVNEEKNEKKGTLSGETTNETSPLASTVENLQKFACSMKDQIVDKVEEIKTKTSNNKNKHSTDTDDDINKDSSGKIDGTIEKSRDNQSGSFRSAGIPKTENEETKSAAVWLAPVAPAEAAKV